VTLDTIGALFHGFAIAFTPGNLLAVFLGSFIGTVIGVLPGLGPTATLALLLPITIGMDMVTALIMMAGIYYGAMYGGSTTSILVNNETITRNIKTRSKKVKLLKS
jgi:putative tricarboxylic transport membrane protein